MPNWFFFKANSSSKLIALVFVSAVVSLFPQPVLAGFQPVGFQWVAPAEPAVPPAYAPAQNSWNPGSSEALPPIMSAPATPVMQAPVAAPSRSTPALAGENPEIISPIVIEGAPLAPAAASTPSVPGRAQPASLGTLPMAASPDTMVQGFANNVPLAVALREVLPPGYGFSIDQDVDLGTLVSFQGGKSWRETLQAMLQPADLVMREQNQMIAIGRSQGLTGVVAPPPEVAMNNAPAPSMSASPTPTNVPAWPGPAAYGPRPAIAQPVVTLPHAPPPPPPVSSSRMSSTGIVDTWTASRGDTLHKVLEDWSHRAGAEFEWSAEYDYPLQASISYTGTFEEAVRDLLSGFEEAHPQPIAELHANSGAGQMVLVIQTRGNSYTD